VVFLRPYDEVVAMWRRCIEYAYAPERLFKRFAHQVEATYAKRLLDGPVRGKLTWNNISLALVLAFNIAVRIGIAADYRRWFWKAALAALRRGQIDAAFSIGIVGHHMIAFSREALRGEQNASFYSAQTRQMAAQSPPPTEVVKLRKSG
jgi:hopanoid C-2 methylase